MIWIIERTDQGGGFLALPGSEKSYTRDARKARRFSTREAAERECCANERPVLL